MEDLEQPILGSKENYGKFKDAESLLRAYNNLEAEFTKKSQKLKSLEGELEQEAIKNTKKAEVDKKVDDFVTKFEIVKPFSSALKESLMSDDNLSLEEEAVKHIANNYKTALDYINDEEFLNNYVYSNQQIKDKIVKDYLSKLTQNSPIKVDSKAITLTPPKVPTNFTEAGKIAKTIIKQK